MVDALKEIIRKSCINIRNNLNPHYQILASDEVCKRIYKLKSYQQAKRIALYQAVYGEINLANIWNRAPWQGKYCYFPAVTENSSLLFLPATPKTPFKTNRYGILEPDVDLQLAIAVADLDIIFVPLVAFDVHGTRLGMGKGYYDRTLANALPKTLIGVAYEFQKQQYIAPELWDVALNQVITEINQYP